MFALGMLSTLAIACSADAPLPPLEADIAMNRALPRDASPSVAAAERTFNLEVGWTASFEVGSRQYQRFVRYHSSDAQVAEITSTGVIRALAEGTATVTGTLGTTSTTAQVIVTSPEPPPEVDDFKISPKYGAAIDIGATQKFTAEAMWSDGVARPVGVTYRATGGTVSNMGLFSAGQTAGVFTVIATCVCGLADTAFLRVGPVPAQLASLKISPKTVTLQPGAVQQFNSVGRWNTGDTTPPPRIYSATGGTITATGAYTAGGTPGTYRVIVAHAGGTLRDTAVVTLVVSGSNPDAPAPPASGPPAVAGPGWTIHEDFEGEGLGTRPRFMFEGTPPRSGSITSSERSLSGDRSARLAIAQGSDGWGHFGGIVRFPKHVKKGETVRVRSHFWMPADFDHNQRNGERLKFLRIHTLDRSGGHVGYLDLHYNRRGESNPFTWSYEGGGYPKYWRGFGVGSPVRKERWQSFEWAVTMDNVPMSEGGLARVLVWIDGKLVADIKDAPTLSDPEGYATRFLLFTYWNGNAQQDAFLYVDDLTVTTSAPTKLDADGNPFLGG